MKTPTIASKQFPSLEAINKNLPTPTLTNYMENPNYNTLYKSTNSYVIIFIQYHWTWGGRGGGGQRTARTDDKPIKVQAENETCTQSSNESCKPANIIIAVYNI